MSGEKKKVCTLVISIGLMNKSELRQRCKTLVVQISNSCHTYAGRSLET